MSLAHRKGEDMNFDTKIYLGVVGCFVLLVLMLVLGMGCYDIVPAGHRGISVTMGKVDKRVLGEGFVWKKPFIESIVKMPIQQLAMQSEAASFSSDLQTVKVKYVVLYRIPEGKVVEIFQQYSGDPYLNLVEPRVQEAIKQVAAHYKAEELVKNREVIKQAVMEKAISEIGGMLDIRDIPVTNIDLTDELEKAIEQKQVTEQEALAKQYELQKAQKQAEITVVNAKAEAESVKIKGEALKSSPEVIQLEIAKKWSGVPPQSVVVSTGGANVLLPLK